MLIDEIAGKDEKVVVVGHDWGAYMAWYLCLSRPDKIAALFNTSVMFKLFGKIRPLDGCRTFFGDDYYICRFQVLLLHPYILFILEEFLSLVLSLILIHEIAGFCLKTEKVIGITSTKFSIA